MILFSTKLASRAWKLVLPAFLLACCAGVLSAQDGAVQKTSAQTQALRERAFAELRAGRWAEADRLFDEVAEQTNSDPLTLYGRALAKFNLGMVPAAGQLLDKAIPMIAEEGPGKRTLADCLVLSAIISAREGNNGSAVTKLRRAVNIVPDHFDAVFSLARALFGNGDLKGAEIYFRKALELKPNDLRARFFLATALEDLGKNDAALKEYRSIVKADPGNVNGNLGLGVLLVKTEGDGSAEGLAALRKVISLSGRNYEARITLGKSLVRQGSFREAIEHLKVAAEIAPQNPEPFYQLALAYRRLGNKEESRKAMEKVREIHQARRGVPNNR